VLHTIVDAVRSTIAWITNTLADVLEAVPAPEGTVPLPWTGMPAETAMDYYARNVTSALLYGGSWVVLALPAFTSVSPRLAVPVGDLMQTLAIKLVARNRRTA
jgi:hypothetical protein